MRTDSQSSDHAARQIMDGTSPILLPLTDLDGLRAAGLAYPSSVDGWRWLYRVRRERGVEDGFRRIGRRILVDVRRMSALMQQAGQTA